MEPVNKQSLYHQVLDQLLASISQGEFPPGSQLPSERELMTMIGVGRPSIREALLALQQMGLIRISHGERARVLKPSPETMIAQVSSAMNLLLMTSERGLEELKEARLWLEAGMVRRAAEAAGPEDLDRLASSVRRMRDTSGDAAAFIAADMSFHVALAEIGKNSLVVAVVRGMLTWLTTFKRDYVSVPGAEALTVEEHERILAAVTARDPDAAAGAMADHLQRANELYRQVTATELQSSG